MHSQRVSERSSTLYLMRKPTITCAVASLPFSGERLALSRDRKKELLASWKSEPKGIAAWLVKPLPAYSYLVVFLLFGILYWLLPPKVVTETKIAEREVPVFVTDTVTVVRVDTLWRERVIKVAAPLVAQNDQPEDPALIQPAVESKSLSEQEDLLDLVVRGE